MTTSTTKKETPKKTSTNNSTAKVKALESQVASLKSEVAAMKAYLTTFDTFLASTMISTNVDPSASETLRELATNVRDS